MDTIVEWNGVLQIIYLETLFSSMAMALMLEKVGYDKIKDIFDQLMR